MQRSKTFTMGLIINDNTLFDSGLNIANCYITIKSNFSILKTDGQYLAHGMYYCYLDKQAYLDQKLPLHQKKFGYVINNSNINIIEAIYTNLASEYISIIHDL